MWAPREDKVHKGHWEERWWPTGLLTPQADTCPAAPQARTTWHALVFGADEKCIWDKSCLRKKTWGSGHPLPPQSSLCSLCNKLDCQKFYSWTMSVGGTWESAPPRSACYGGFICLLKIFQCSEVLKEISVFQQFSLTRPGICPGYFFFF